MKTQVEKNQYSVTETTGELYAIIHNEDLTIVGGGDSACLDHYDKDYIEYLYKHWNGELFDGQISIKSQSTYSVEKNQYSVIGTTGELYAIIHNEDRTIVGGGDGACEEHYDKDYIEYLYKHWNGELFDGRIDLEYQSTYSAKQIYDIKTKEIFKIRSNHIDVGFATEIFETEPINGKPRYVGRELDDQNKAVGRFYTVSDAPLGFCELNSEVSENCIFDLCTKDWEFIARFDAQGNQCTIAGQKELDAIKPSSAAQKAIEKVTNSPQSRAIVQQKTNTPEL